jgi:hypothetical protein
MGASTFRPDVEVGGPSTVTGTGDAAAVTNDTPDDDATYFTKAPGEVWTVVDLTSATIGADSLVKLIEPRIRARSTGSASTLEVQLRTTGSAILSTTSISVDGSFAEYDANSYVNPALTQTHVNDLKIAVRAVVGSVDVSEIYVDTTWAEQPTTNVTGPTGTVTTSTPPLEFTHTAGVNGGPQAAWWVKVFSNAQYSATNFDPDVTYPTWQATGTSTVDEVTPSPLAHDTDYRDYGKTAQLVGGIYHWADWDFSSFTVDLVGPQVDDITIDIDDAFARLVASISRNTGGDAWDYVDLQRMAEANRLTDDTSLFSSDTDANGVADGWDPTAVGASVTWSRTGGYQRATVTSIDDGDAVEIQQGEPSAVVGGQSYTAGITVKAPTMAANTRIALGIRFFDALGNVLENSSLFLDTGLISTVDSSYSHSADAPLTAAYAAVVLTVIGVSGASASATTADFTDAWLVDGAEDDIWVDVAGASDVVPGADDVVIIDAFAPGNTPVRYRARASDASSNVGAWVYASGSYEWEQTSSWIKCPQRPGFSTPFCLAERPTFKRPRRRGVHEIIDASAPRTASGKMQTRRGNIPIETETIAEYNAVMAALEEPVVLFQFHPDYHMPQMWASLGDIDEAYKNDRAMTLAWRDLEVDVVEVLEP